MKIEIYTKDNCPECVKVKQKVKSFGFDYDEKQLTPDNTVEFMQTYRTRSAPVCFVDGEFKTNDEMIHGHFLKINSEDLDLDIDL